MSTSQLVGVWELLSHNNIQTNEKQLLLFLGRYSKSLGLLYFTLTFLLEFLDKIANLKKIASRVMLLENYFNQLLSFFG